MVSSLCKTISGFFSLIGKPILSVTFSFSATMPASEKCPCVISKMGSVWSHGLAGSFAPASEPMSACYGYGRDHAVVAFGGDEMSGDS
jgi:hypothetical protein